MEGLQQDFGSEDDSEDDIIKIKGKTSSAKSEKRSFAQEIFGLTDKDKAPNKENEKVEKLLNLDSDKTPELDSEAPVEHLSKVEAEAISQTLATERLKAIHQEVDQPTAAEDLAAEAFLENVEVSGDLQLAFDQTINEIGLQPDQRELSQINFLEINDQQLTAEELPLKETSELSQDQVISPTHEADDSKPVNNIVDYLVERRKGRLESEEKTPPVKQRMEKEVTDLKHQLEGRELYLRQMVERRVKPEIQTDARSVRPERIGKVIVESDIPVMPPPLEKIQQTTSEKPELSNLKAQTMNYAELLTLAAKIDIDGTNLRQVYESHLLGEKGLRRVIAIYLRGGNVRRSLRRELVEREIDFERDPSLRDQASSQSVASNSTTLDSLLTKSGIDWTEPVPASITPKKKSAQLSLQADFQRQRSAMLRTVADILMAIILLIMATIIIVLIIKK